MMTEGSEIAFITENFKMVGQVNNNVNAAFTQQFQKRDNDQVQSDRQKKAQELAQSAFAATKKPANTETKPEAASKIEEANARPAKTRGSLFDQTV